MRVRDPRAPSRSTGNCASSSLSPILRYDPLELFPDPKIPLVKLKIAWRLLQQKLGLMSNIL
jgi:hypothetical protein